MSDLEREPPRPAGGGAVTHAGCACIPSDDDSGSVTASGSACACQHVEKVVKNSDRKTRVDLVKVAIFTALLIVLALALALGW